MEYDEAEIFLQERGTPTERFSKAITAFEDLAKSGDEEVAQRILANLEGIDTSKDGWANQLNKDKVAIVQVGIAKVRRGDNWDTLATAVSAATGLTVGYLLQKMADWRPVGSMPLWGPAGAVGVLAGTMVDTTLTMRNVAFTGGSMFTLGTWLYTLTNPRAPVDTLQAEPVGS